MKNASFLLVSIFSFIYGAGQPATTSNAMSQEFIALTKMGGGGVTAFQSYSSNQVDGSQFFLPDWHKGEVVTNNKDVFNQGFQFVYDKVRQELFIRQKDSALILTGNKEDIKFFKLKNAGNEYLFVNSAMYTDTKPVFFYQVLVSDSSRFTLLKYNKTKFVKADRTDMMKERDGNVYDAFVDENTYYIVKGKSGPEPVQLKTKAVRKVF